MTVNKLQLQAAIYEYFMLQKKLDNSIKSRVYIEELNAWPSIQSLDFSLLSLIITVYIDKLKGY